MRPLLIASCFLLLLVSCKTTTFYIARHAEKEATNTMTSDVPLSQAGKQRAEALKTLLATKKISAVYSTNYIRTKSTAQPLATAKGLSIQQYNPADTGFITGLKNNKGMGDVLIIGHSNTVDDLVNKLLGEKKLSDLPDSQYGDLFIVKRKGKKYTFEQKHFGL